MVFTDILASIACAYGVLIILFATRKNSSLKTYWTLFFIFCSVSFLTSGISHAMHNVANNIKLLSRISWSFAVAGVTSFAVGVASVENSVRRTFINIVWCFCTVCIIFVIMGINFTWIVLYCFAAMFLTIIINSYNKIISFKHSHSKGILIGTGLYVLAAILYILFRDSKYFDIRPISHIIIVFGIILFANSCKNTILQFADTINEQKKTAYEAAKKST